MGFPDFLPPIGADGPLVTVLVAATVLYVLYHYGLDDERLAARYERSGPPAGPAHERAVLTRRVGGGILFLAGPTAVLLALSLSPLDHGLGAASLRGFVAALVLIAVILPTVALTARKPSFWEQYPELRSPTLSRGLLARSGLAWAVYLTGYEFLFRGFLLFFLRDALGVWPALAITTAVYAISHIGKPVDETAGSIVMGFGFGILALYAGAIWPAVLLHVCIAWGAELLVVRANPAITLTD